MKPNLTLLKHDIDQLPDDGEKRYLIDLIASSEKTDRQYEAMTVECLKEQKKIRFFGLLMTPFSVLATIGSWWYVIDVIRDGFITSRGKTIIATVSTLEYWFCLFFPIVGAIVSAMLLWCLMKYWLFGLTRRSTSLPSVAGRCAIKPRSAG